MQPYWKFVKLLSFLILIIVAQFGVQPKKIIKDCSSDKEGQLSTVDIFYVLKWMPIADYYIYI